MIRRSKLLTFAIYFFGTLFLSVLGSSIQCVQFHHSCIFDYPSNIPYIKVSLLVASLTGAAFAFFPKQTFRFASYPRWKIVLIALGLGLLVGIIRILLI